MLVPDQRRQRGADAEADRISMYSSREPMPYPAMAASPSRPIRPVTTSTVPFVRMTTRQATRPTFRMSRNERQRNPSQRPAQAQRRLRTGELGKHPQRGEGEGYHRRDGGAADAEGGQAETIPGSGHR